MTTPSRFEISSINWRNTDLKLDKESEAEIEDEILTGSSLQTYPTLIAELLQITLPILKFPTQTFSLTFTANIEIHVDFCVYTYN